MFSMPPATALSTMPSMISCAAETMAWAPEPQTRLTVIAGTSTGKPPWIAACRAGFILLPAWIDIAHDGSRDLRVIELSISQGSP